MCANLLVVSSAPDHQMIICNHFDALRLLEKG